MFYIAHRVNTIEHLRAIPVQFGVEVDLRDDGGRIVLQHDPFQDGRNSSSDKLLVNVRGAFLCP